MTPLSSSDAQTQRLTDRRRHKRVASPLESTGSATQESLFGKEPS